jgi:hypothetical protein
MLYDQNWTPSFFLSGWAQNQQHALCRVKQIMGICHGDPEKHKAYVQLKKKKNGECTQGAEGVCNPIGGTTI